MWHIIENIVLPVTLVLAVILDSTVLGHLIGNALTDVKKIR